MIHIDIRRAIKSGTDLGLFISFPYNTDVVNVMREQPIRFWHNESKEWEIPFKRLGTLLEELDKFEIEITADDASMFQARKENPVNYQFKTNPFKHQVEGFNYGLEHDRWLLGDEQGLGKTKQVIDIAVAKKQQRGYKHCLIICGVNGLKWNWANEVATHSNEKAWIIGQQTKKNKVTIGSNTEKAKQLNALLGADLDAPINDCYFLITNVESLRDKDICLMLSDLCRQGIIGLVAADEVHKMKNPQSQQGKGFLTIQADTMIAMTGTPLMNTPLDLYIILKWLGYEDHNYYSFKSHYCEMGGYGNYQIVGYRHLDALQAQLNEFMLRRLKADVLDLPEKTYINEYVEMTAKQAQIYKEVHAQITSNIDKVKESNNPLAEMIRLRQATGYTGILSSTVQESAKLDRMVELVEDAIANGKKVVIFSNWTQMTTAIENKLTENNIYCYDTITGETKDEDRQYKVNSFQAEDGCKILIGTIGAMGTGLTLTAGTVEIFLDEPWTMAAKEQAVDRCHRIGQHNNVTVYTLLTKDTIDEKINDIVAKKGAMSDMLVDGKVIDKKALVDYLLS
jgi:SNF2 family DNA or RNA helicase